ncbi:MAG: tRNA lysidine(34) synthetase TilS [Treponemataceae bacterium]|nr:MAG: tRNA lysidine(34) synthetase TilS [Treponemataceae bacterium]
MHSFEDRVLEGLAVCGIRESSYTMIIAAVSGGADSVALLTALDKLVSDGRLAAQIVALTIDHGIREPQESEGDTSFVRSYCARLGIDCKTETFLLGEVVRTAKARGMGVEEAARFLRYKAFERALDETPGSILCVAHNRDDNLETILMRFLQGSASPPLAGIPALHDRIARPMLGITKRETLEYLESRGITFRRDSTNEDTAFLRNNIRLNLIPALNRHVPDWQKNTSDERLRHRPSSFCCHLPGWQKAVLTGAEKACDDAELIRGRVEEISWQQNEDGRCLSLSSDVFFCQSRAVRRELVYKAWNTLAAAGVAGGRLPYETVSRVCDGLFPARCGGVAFEKAERRVVISATDARTGETCGESGFCVLIEQPGVYAAGGWTFNAGADDGGVLVELPACARSPLSTDTIAFANGSKSLMKLFSAAKIPARERAKIPVIESGGVVAAVFGIALGKRDWISARSEQFAANAAIRPAGTGNLSSIRIKLEGAFHG